MTRCTNRCPNPPLPAGLSVRTAETHPRYKHLLIPGAQCTLEEGHDGPHRDPGLTWHDPPKLIVGGREP